MNVYMYNICIYIYESYGLSEVIIIFPMKMPFEGHPRAPCIALAHLRS